MIVERIKPGRRLLYYNGTFRSKVGRPPFSLGDDYYRHLFWRFFWRTDLAGYKRALTKAHSKGE
jgi:hypothetical protein